MMKKQDPRTAVPYDDDNDSDCSSNDADSSGIHPEAEHVDEAARQRKTLGSNTESKAVFCLRIVVFCLLFCTAALVSVGVYYFSTVEEHDDFEVAFDIHATRVIESFKDSFDQKTGSIGAMANSITNYATTDPDAAFPFVTVPNFEVLGSDVRVQADALAVVWAPIVQEEQRLEWEEFAFVHRGQNDVSSLNDAGYRAEEDAFYAVIQGGQAAPAAETGGDESNRRSLQGHPNMLPDGSLYHLRIWDITGNHNATADNTGPYLPHWQQSPLPVGQNHLLLNLNWGTTKGMANIYRDVLKDAVEDEAKVIINEAAVPVALGREQIKGMVAHSQFRYETGSQYLDDPTSFLFYPVFDAFNKTERSLAGYLVVQLYWRLFFTDILPITAKGIIAVIENSYNQTLSYRMDGPEVTFLGEGDFHDPSYDAMVVSEDITNYVNSRSSPETRAFRTVQLHDTIGVHKIHVYPTKDTEEEYKSQQPLVYTLVVASVFLVTVMVFFVFNWFVERRQTIVLTRAVQAGAVVSSLFPEQVQERLYNEAENKSNHKRDSNGGSAAWKNNKDQSFDARYPDPFDPAIDGKSSHGGQIADHYPETTIMFADLAGFTKWSSSRSPSDVFDLLETLYSCFDRLALKRNVFKVETIGDCYLAACGLPDPNPNHAILMAKFANDCLNKMDQIVRRVSDRLGPDTADLQLRAGLHSGATVAGVLRGQKSRFQLFGDTVNVAARMESTGMPGRIQVSQETADQLMMKGKAYWLTAREDVVVAKGKGELATFWLQVETEGSVATSAWGGTASITSGGSGHIRNTFITNTLNENDEDDDSEDSFIDEPSRDVSFEQVLWV